NCPCSRSAMFRQLSHLRPSAGLMLTFFIGSGCSDKGPDDKKITRIDSVENVRIARNIESMVNPTLADGLTMRIWATDSLVADPVTLNIDHQGVLYYTRTNRQKNSEFDIRGHRNWEIVSISLQTIEDKRAFLRSELDRK